MLGLPWWIWVVVGLIALYRLGLMAMSKGFRLITRWEFTQFVRDFGPGVEVLGVGERRLRVRSGEAGPVALDLGPLYKDVVVLAPHTVEAKRRVYWKHLKRLHEAAAGQPLLSPGRYATCIRPRLVAPGLLAGVPDGAGMPQTPLGATGLSVVYVLDLNGLDGRWGVVPLTAEDARELGLDDAELHTLSLENLRKNFPADVVRKAVEEGTGAALKMGDSYDAARLLLVPEHLSDGEEVAALIPDHDTLVLAPVPADGDWGRLREGARMTLGHGSLLLDRPLRVSREAVETV